METKIGPPQNVRLSAQLGFHSWTSKPLKFLVVTQLFDVVVEGFVFVYDVNC